MSYHPAHMLTKSTFCLYTVVAQVLIVLENISWQSTWLTVVTSEGWLAEVHATKLVVINPAVKQTPKQRLFLFRHTHSVNITCIHNLTTLGNVWF